MLTQQIFLFAIVIRVYQTFPVNRSEIDEDDSDEIPLRSINRQMEKNDIKKETPSSLLTFISKILGTVDQRCKMAVGRAKKSVDGFRRLGEDVEKQLNGFFSSKL